MDQLSTSGTPDSNCTEKGATPFTISYNQSNIPLLRQGTSGSGGFWQAWQLGGI
jgi:hypothetical protein